MSSLLFLSTEDFYIGQGQRGNLLQHQIRGISLIMFYSTKCVYCQKLVPIFKQLPDIINGCQFGLLNISVNKNIVPLATQTIVPITYVPLIILYFDGKPYMKYDGPADLNAIREFVFQSANSIHQKQTFTNPQSRQQQQRGNGVLETAKKQGYMGQPLIGEGDIDYLQFQEAYEKLKRR